MRSVPLPSRAKLQNAYEGLQWKATTPEPQTLVLWAHWARLDPRLAEIFVHFLGKHFRRIHPTLLWEKNQRSPQPQALAVLVDFARINTKSESTPEDVRAFEQWAASVNRKVQRGAPQFFFLREGMPKPERDRPHIERSLRPFLRWGFFGSESPIGSKKQIQATVLSRGARLSILKELSKNRISFSVRDYVDACGGQIHLRTAERDLRQQGNLESRGSTRARRYRARKFRAGDGLAHLR